MMMMMMMMIIIIIIMTTMEILLINIRIFIMVVCIFAIVNVIVSYST